MIHDKYTKLYHCMQLRRNSGNVIHEPESKRTIGRRRAREIGRGEEGEREAIKKKREKKESDEATRRRRGVFISREADARPNSRCTRA